MHLSENVKQGIILVVSFIFILAFLWALNNANDYKKDAEAFVVYEDTAVEFITEDGNTWLVDVPSTEKYHVGDEVTLTFKNVGDDDNIYNDEVVGIGQ